ncbi:MAG: 50S ribosomal protein L6 [Candidatus Nanoarchaeia archaeon]
MKREIFQTIEIPEGIEIKLNGNIINVKGPEGEDNKKLNLGDLEIKLDGNLLIIGCKKATKKEKKTINTMRAHIKNILEGVSKKFEYKLKICYSHFPITAEVKGNEIIIKNFLGEKSNRKSKIIDGADVKIDKEMVTITSINREIAGQTAANIETATKVRKRDRRVFQDGIFMITKAGKEI